MTISDFKQLLSETWTPVQDRIREELRPLPQQFDTSLAAGEGPATARADVGLASFEIRARNYLLLVSDRPTMTAYTEVLASLATIEFLKVRQHGSVVIKPEGFSDEDWELLMPAEPELRNVSYDLQGAEIDHFQKALSNRLVQWQTAAYNKVLKLELLKIDADILAQLPMNVAQVIDVETTRTFCNHFSGLTQRGRIIDVYYEFQTVVAECHEKIAQACLATITTVYEFSEVLSRNIPYLLTGFITRYLENSAPEIPEPERNMMQRAMALWMKRMDPAFEIETRGEPDTDLEFNLVIPMWNQLGEQKQRLMLEYKERAASLNSGTDIADKAKPGTPECLDPPDQQLPSRSISQQVQNNPLLDIRMANESEKEFEENWKAEMDRSKAPHLNESAPPESIIEDILEFTRRRPSQILHPRFEQALVRAYGRLAANSLQSKSEEVPHPLDHQDLLDMKASVKTMLLQRLDRDLNGIAVQGTGKRRPRDLEGAIERRIDESLQIKQDEIIRRRTVTAPQSLESAEKERDTLDSANVGLQTIAAPKPGVSIDATLTEHPNVQGELQTEAHLKKKRGRKTAFTLAQMNEARAMKINGKRNNEIAKVLYGTLTPTPQQRRSVPTILKYHFPQEK
jgi:hypothetical protein